MPYSGAGSVENAITTKNAAATTQKPGPGVEVHLTASATGSSGLADDLRGGRLDVALLGLPPSELGGLDVRPLARTSYVRLLPAEHRLARRRQVRLTDLADERFVDALPGFGNRLAVDRAFDAAAIRRRVVVEVSDLGTVPDHVAEGWASLWSPTSCTPTTRASSCGPSPAPP